MTYDRDRAFLKAQREYDNRTPPEAPDPCPWHGWEYDDDEPDVTECPDCESARDAYEADAYDRWRDDRMMGDDE